MPDRLQRGGRSPAGPPAHPDLGRAVETIVTGIDSLRPGAPHAVGHDRVRRGERDERPRCSRSSTRCRRPVSSIDARATQRRHRSREHRPSRRARAGSRSRHRALPERRHVLRRREPARRGTAGGAYFKFIPTHARGPGGAITNLAQSPLARGHVYGCARASAAATPTTARAPRPAWDAVLDPGRRRRCSRSTCVPPPRAKLTGYYRPEDLDIDRAALASGRRAVLRQQHRQRGRRPQLRRDDLRDRRHARTGCGQHRHARSSSSS